MLAFVKVFSLITGKKIISLPFGKIMVPNQIQLTIYRPILVLTVLSRIFQRLLQNSFLNTAKLITLNLGNNLDLELA